MKARRQPTAEQKAKAAERRERFRALAAQVAALSEDERAALVMKVGAIVTCEGRALSPFNSCLVLNQLPTASMVGGFRQWKNKGRSVKKGEHGLMIWVPTGKGEDGETIPVPETDAGADGEKPKRAGFIMGTVFDVSQTEPNRDHSGDRQQMDELAQDMADVGSL
jgi:hypothetical protein